MEDILVGALGPFKNWILGLSFAIVVLARHSIRKRHIVRLLLATVLAAVAFFGVLLLSFATWDGTQSVVLIQGVLGLLATIALGCGSAIGFSLILKSLGLASLEDR